MELKDYWNPNQRVPSAVKTQEIKKPFTKKSRHPLRQLHRRIRTYFFINAIGILFTGTLIALFPITIVRILLVLVFLAQLWSAKRTYDLFQEIQTALNDEKTDMLKLLKQQLTLIREFLRLEERLTIFTTPFALTGGFIAGGLTSSSMPPTEFFLLPLVQIGLIVTLLVFIPLFYIITKWVNRILFGQHLQSLTHMIHSIENHTEQTTSGAG